MYQNSPVCPVCGQMDAVRKVSNVVSEGTASTDQMGVAPNLLGGDLFVLGSQGTMVTELAQRLIPVTKRPGGIGLRVSLAAIALVLGSMMACGLSAFAVTPEFGRFACGNWVLGIALVAGALVIWPLAGIPGIRRRQDEYDRMMQQASARWQRLYYCSRDDVAFDPGQGVVIPVPSLSQYLYTQARA